MLVPPTAVPPVFSSSFSSPLYGLFFKDRECTWTNGHWNEEKKGKENRVRLFYTLVAFKQCFYFLRCCFVSFFIHCWHREIFQVSILPLESSFQSTTRFVRFHLGARSQVRFEMGQVEMFQPVVAAGSIFPLRLTVDSITNGRASLIISLLTPARRRYPILSTGRCFLISRTGNWGPVHSIVNGIPWIFPFALDIGYQAVKVSRCDWNVNSRTTVTRNVSIMAQSSSSSIDNSMIKPADKIRTISLHYAMMGNRLQACSDDCP